MLLCALVVGWPSAIRADLDRPTWTVQPGDALSLIAEKAQVSVAELKRWNDLDSDLIQIGQILIVGPRYAEVTDTPQSVPAEPQNLTSAKDAKSTSDHDNIDWTPPFEYEEAPPVRSEASSPRIASARIPERILSSPEPKKRDDSLAYRIVRGDTLTGIADRFGTTVSAIINANPGVKPDRIYPGQAIDIREPRPEVRYIVERGDSIERLAARHETTPRQLYAWNPNVRRGALKPNASITLFTRKPVSQSEALGATNRGRLKWPAHLPRHKGYVMRAPDRAWGTEETIRWIVGGFDAVAKQFGRNKRVRVHDISDRNGGRMRDHKSHQTGRDADIGYYQKSCAKGVCPFESFRPRKLDVQRQWTLLHYWLRHDQAELIFIDYRLQAPLYRQAKRKGATRAQLASWFQYPRGKGVPRGTIRHYRNHRNHLHVRFVCPYSDQNCR